jgi:hypothetical protein
VIITQISKEVENNNIGRLNVYSRDYVSGGLREGDARTRTADGATGSYSGGGSSGRC